jgi:hypothetical protein
VSGGRDWKNNQPKDGGDSEQSAAGKEVPFPASPHPKKISTATVTDVVAG